MYKCQSKQLERSMTKKMVYVTRARLIFPRGKLEKMPEHTTLKRRSCQLHWFLFQSSINYSGLVAISFNTEGIVLRRE